MIVKKDSWHYKLNTYALGKSASYYIQKDPEKHIQLRNNLCKYFWLTIDSILFAIFDFIFRKINTVLKYPLTKYGNPVFESLDESIDEDVSEMIKVFVKLLAVIGITTAVLFLVTPLLYLYYLVLFFVYGDTTQILDSVFIVGLTCSIIPWGVIIMIIMKENILLDYLSAKKKKICPIIQFK